MDRALGGYIKASHHWVVAHLLHEFAGSAGDEMLRIIPFGFITGPAILRKPVLL
jgi:hypothetical protein